MDHSAGTCPIRASLEEDNPVPFVDPFAGRHGLVPVSVDLKDLIVQGLLYRICGRRMARLDACGNGQHKKAHGGYQPRESIPASP